MKYRLKELIAQKELKENRHITLTEIAKEIDISRVTLSRIANSRGKYKIKFEYAQKLCDYFGIDFNDLIIPDPPASEESIQH